MLGVGLYGDNGHQIQNELKNNPKARLAGVCAFKAPPDNVKVYADLEDMLADKDIDIVSLCSPIRAEQAAHAVACLNAGKHVYAEKPCALTEEDLDMVMDASRKTGKIFREMAGTAFSEPYFSMSKIVTSGKLGEIVQVFAQKSYPYHDNRPQDEKIDGGLTLQAGIHALRMVEQVAHVRIKEMTVLETSLGNPKPPGGLKMASCLSMILENGGLASVIVNYLNQPGHGAWGNDHLRIFGTKGFVESTDGGLHTRVIFGKDDWGEIPLAENTPSYFDTLLDAIANENRFPLTLDEELHPLRMAIRARNAVRNGSD